MRKYGKSKTLEKLGLNFKEAISFLEENNIPIVLTEEDKYITNQEKEYKGLEDFILVHKTDFIPIQSKIKSAKDSQALVNKQIILNGKEYNYMYARERNTVHFAVNDEVYSHAYGNWDNSKYAVLIPLIDIPKEKVGMFSSVDTFTNRNSRYHRKFMDIMPKR